MAHVTDMELAGKRRLYTQRHRKLWMGAGFKQCSMFVHDDDKAEVAATTEMLRYSRLLKLVKANSPEAIDMVATRNCAKVPMHSVLLALKGDTNTSTMAETNKTRIGSLLERSKHHLKHFELNSAYYDSTESEEDDPDKLRALMVCHSNLASAAYKLAGAVYDNNASPKEGKGE